VFKVGYLYTIFGYEVYLGEALVTLAVIALVALLCIKSKTVTAKTMVVLVLLFTAGITIVTLMAMMGHRGTGLTMRPAFVPDKGALQQVMRIAFLSPWAFIGFESVSHSAMEYKFEHKRMFRILVTSVTVVTALYIFVILLSITAFPEGCSNWLDYISRLDEFEGIAGLPAFYAAHHYLGDAGVYILMASLLALVLSSLIGMLRAVSRLCYAVAHDGVLPERFSKLSKKRIPVNAILLACIVSLPIPFVGRTAIGWIVDTTTIGATITYGFASVAVFKVSGQEGAKKNRLISGICLLILVAFMAFLLLPGIFSDHTIETETYVLMIGWSVIGLFYFNWVIRRDHARSFGKAIIVWVAMLAFIVLMSTTLAERFNEASENVVVEDIANYINGTADAERQAMSTDEFLETVSVRLHAADNTSAIIIFSMFGLAAAVMFVNYRTTGEWEKKAIAERDEAHTVAYTDPLTGVKSKHAFAVKEGHMETQIVDGDVGEFGVIVCDVNGLKKINDTLGHKAGDEYICAACRMLCEYFKHSPVFRIGGDEFVVLLQGRDYEDRHDIMHDINAEIEGNIGKDKVVISLGLSDYDPEVDESFHEVFQRADNLMYERKMQLKSMGAVTRD
jgi:diguanylate cyclase (GGDEF)-like protein